MIDVLSVYVTRSRIVNPIVFFYHRHCHRHHFHFRCYYQKFRIRRRYSHRIRSNGLLILYRNHYRYRCRHQSYDSCQHLAHSRLPIRRRVLFFVIWSKYDQMQNFDLLTSRRFDS